MASLKEKPDSRSAIIIRGHLLGSELVLRQGCRGRRRGRLSSSTSSSLRDKQTPGAWKTKHRPDEVRLWHPNPVFVAGFGYCFFFFLPQINCN